MKRIAQFIIISVLLFAASCSSPLPKDQEQREKELYSSNNIKIQKMYTIQCIDGKPVDSTMKLVSEFYFDRHGNQKTVYNCDTEPKKLSKVIVYDSSENKVLEIWLGGLRNTLKWQYYEHHYDYDSNNRMAVQYIYNTIGTFYHLYAYKYDKQGRLSSSLLITPDTVVQQVDSIFYQGESKDASEKRVYMLNNSNGPFLFMKTTYKYNKDGQLVEDVLRLYDYELTYRNTYRYNSEGLMLEQTSWDDKTNLPNQMYNFEYVRYKGFN